MFTLAFKGTDQNENQKWALEVQNPGDLNKQEIATLTYWPSNPSGTWTGNVFIDDQNFLCEADSDVLRLSWKLYGFWDKNKFMIKEKS